MVNNNAVLEFRHNTPIVANADQDTNLPALFNKITLPGTITDVEGLQNVKIIVKAEAIQADGFETAEAAFTALDAAANK